MTLEIMPWKGAQYPPPHCLWTNLPYGAQPSALLSEGRLALALSTAGPRAVSRSEAQHSAFFPEGWLALALSPACPRAASRSEAQHFAFLPEGWLALALSLACPRVTLHSEAQPSAFLSKGWLAMALSLACPRVDCLSGILSQAWHLADPVSETPVQACVQLHFPMSLQGGGAGF
jgi:hypothetical protein